MCMGDIAQSLCCGRCLGILLKCVNFLICAVFFRSLSNFLLMLNVCEKARVSIGAVTLKVFVNKWSCCVIFHPPVHRGIL